MPTLEETAAFSVHPIKQFCYGFERMHEMSSYWTDGSPCKAFYLNALYHFIATFYLLDKQDRPMGGTFYPSLVQHRLETLLQPIQEILETPIGDTTFGEAVRVFRNKALVHTKYRDADLDRIYSQVDMMNSETQEKWQALLLRTYQETAKLAVQIASKTGRPLSEFGINEETVET